MVHHEKVAANFLLALFCPRRVWRALHPAWCTCFDCLADAWLREIAHIRYVAHAFCCESYQSGMVTSKIHSSRTGCSGAGVLFFLSRSDRAAKMRRCISRAWQPARLADWRKKLVHLKKGRRINETRQSCDAHTPLLDFINEISKSRESICGWNLQLWWPTIRDLRHIAIQKNSAERADLQWFLTFLEHNVKKASFFQEIEQIYRGVLLICMCPFCTEI